jgi:hypothetical protein
MKQIKKDELKNIKNWIYRNARPLDFFRWQYHFENGDKSNVLSVLSSFQNPDGGFGHALEADSWNPFSSPLQTSTAILLLREINYFNEADPIIMGILSFLENDSSFLKSGWIQKIPTNNDFPHAPWWTYDKEKIGGFHSEWEYNPTANIIGFTLRVIKNKKSAFYKKCLNIANEAIEKLLSVDTIEPHELGCFCSLYTNLIEAGITVNFQLNDIEQKLKKLINQSIEYDTSKWNNYVTKPSSYINSPESIFYSENKSIMDFELDYIIDSINKDGIWDINWTWGAYEKEFAISGNWWQGHIIIQNYVLLNNFSRIV